MDSDLSALQHHISRDRDFSGGARDELRAACESIAARLTAGEAARRLARDLEVRMNAVEKHCARLERSIGILQRAKQNKKAPADGK